MSDVPETVDALLGLAPITPGMRVLTRPRLECAICWFDRPAWAGTPEDWDGVECVVLAVLPALSHPYAVRPLAGRFSDATWDCARGELEVIR